MSKKKFSDAKSIFRSVVKYCRGIRFGRNAWTFLVFLVISFILWLSMGLNEIIRRDIVCDLRIVNLPDSVTFLTDPPEEIILDVRARGTQLIKYEFGSRPVINIDYRYYHHGNKVSLTRAEFRSIAQTALGSTRVIEAMSPDTLGLLFTTLEPAQLPVTVQAVVNTAPNCRQVRPVTALVDTVKVYSIKPLSDRIKSINTEPLKFYDVDKTFVSRVRLAAPSGCRVVPDSVDIRIEVEPVMSRSKMVEIEPVNVPPRYCLRLMPRTVRVDYFVFAGKKAKDVDIHVVADFNTLPDDFSSEKIGIRLAEPMNDVFLAADSVEYLIQVSDIDE